MEKTILLDNIKCHGCANSIEKAVLKFDGIEAVNVDIEAGSITITYDNYDEEAFGVKLAKLGYPPQGTSSTGQKIKSFVSCATGRI